MVNGKFPNGLQAAMKGVGLGPTALGRLIGESKQNVDRWAKGSRRLQPEDAMKIAPHVEVSVDALLLLSKGGKAQREPVVNDQTQELKSRLWELFAEVMRLEKPADLQQIVRLLEPRLKQFQSPSRATKTKQAV